MKKTAFIFDIDWTLAKMNWRNPYDYTKVSTDIVNTQVCRMQKILSRDFDILIVSGRKEICRKDTEDWLSEKWITYTQLFTRKDWDNRNDAIIKEEIYREHIEPHYVIVWVFDDRDRVVAMWRKIGLQCYQVDYGNF